MYSKIPDMSLICSIGINVWDVNIFEHESTLFFACNETFCNLSLKVPYYRCKMKYCCILLRTDIYFSRNCLEDYDLSPLGANLKISFSNSIKQYISKYEIEERFIRTFLKARRVSCCWLDHFLGHLIVLWGIKILLPTPFRCGLENLIF